MSSAPASALTVTDVFSGACARATGVTFTVIRTGVKLSAPAPEASSAQDSRAMASTSATRARAPGHGRIPSLVGWLYIVAGVAGLYLKPSRSR